MLTNNFKLRKLAYGYQITHVNGKRAPQHLAKVRIPPAWRNVMVEMDPACKRVAVGVDEAGRPARLYSDEHKAKAKATKFDRVRLLLDEFDVIGEQIRFDAINPDSPPRIREAALVALLIHQTGMRPGSDRELALTTGVQAYGATTLQMRHVKPRSTCCVLAFVGKKGVSQRVRVNDPYLATELAQRKGSTVAWSAPVFQISVGILRDYFKTLGSGRYTPKDFRTARGTSLAIKLLGNRKRLPKAKSRLRKLVNAALDRVAKQLGNTRAVSRNSYVDPGILSRFLEVK